MDQAKNALDMITRFVNDKPFSAYPLEDAEFVSQDANTPHPRSSIARPLRIGVSDQAILTS